MIECIYIIKPWSNVRTYVVCVYFTQQTPCLYLICNIDATFSDSLNKQLFAFFSSHRILDTIPANVFVKIITKIIIELWSGSCYMLEAWRRSVIWKGHNQSEKCPNYSKFRKGWLSGASQQTAEPLKTLQKSLLLKICTWVKLDQDSPD